VARLPIRAKVTLAFTVALAVVLVGTGAFLYLQMAAELEQATDRGLRARADEVAGLIDRTAPALPRAAAPGLEADESITHVLRGDGAVLAASSHAPVRLLHASQLRAALGGPVVVERPSDAALDESLRILAIPVLHGDETVVVAVATSSDERTEALAALLVIEVAGLGLALIAAAAVGYLVAGLALSPVEAMRRRAEAITDADDARLPAPPVDDELGRLGATLNAMLDRIRRARAAERAALETEHRFIADASHQLRTPLTIMKAELELALLDGATPAGLRRALESTAQETDRLVRLSNHLLLPVDVPLRPEPLTATALLDAVTERHRHRPDAAGRPVRTAAAPDLVVLGDRLRLEQALDNLVDNALVHGQGEINLNASPDATGVQIMVRDHGPGFPPGFAAHAFERFRRGASTGPGSGLGLAIVAAVADAHGGQAFVAEDGPGATVVLALPSSRTDQRMQRRGSR
jgi:two-component system, OmpR family, sensor kinase